MNPGPGRPVSPTRPSRPRHTKAGCMPGRKRRLGENGCQSFGHTYGPWMRHGEIFARMSADPAAADVNCSLPVGCLLRSGYE